MGGPTPEIWSWIFGSGCSNGVFPFSALLLFQNSSSCSMALLLAPKIYFRVSNFSEEIPFGLGYWDSTSHRIPLPCGKVVDSQNPKVLWTVILKSKKVLSKGQSSLLWGLVHIIMPLFLPWEWWISKLLFLGYLYSLWLGSFPFVWCLSSFRTK